MVTLSGPPAPMRFDTRADLFAQLAAMEEAGLPFEKVLDVVHLPSNERPRLKAMSKWIKRGVGIAEAGLRSGLFTPLEATLVRAATSSGSPARTYRLLADQCARRAARVKAIKSRMALPAVMIAAAIILGPVPRLVAGDLTPTGYLAKHLLPWIAAGVSAYLLLGRVRRQRAGGYPTWRIRLDGVVPFVPMFGPMEVRRNLRDFFDSMALLLEAGVPILEAFPLALDTVRNQALKSQLARIKPRIEAGTSFGEAFAGLPLFGCTQAYGMIHTGEASGTLPRMLLRYSEAETASINRFDDLVAEWIPRLVYTSAALLTAYAVISSGAFMPSLPPELQ